jgi:hypothetical protein
VLSILPSHRSHLQDRERIPCTWSRSSTSKMHLLWVRENLSQQWEFFIWTESGWSVSTQHKPPKRLPFRFGSCWSQLTLFRFLKHGRWWKYCSWSSCCLQSEIKSKKLLLS